MSKGSALVSILFAFFAGVVIGNVTGSSSGPQSGDSEQAAAADADVKGVEEKDGPDRFKVPISASQPTKGAEDALVTIVEFSDFECPFCSRVEPTMDQIQKDYAGKVKVVWRNNPLPFHKNAMPAAQAAMEAFAQGGSPKFWAMHKKLFDNQKALTRPDLEKYAQEIGLDATKFKAALDGDTHQSKIKGDQELSQRLGASGTPAFFINGRFLSGAQPLPRFKEVIDDELKRADKLLATGVAKNKVYATLTKNGLTSAKAPSEAAADAPKQKQPDPKAVYKVPVDKSSPVKGPADALVTIVEFSEFQCPFCNRVLPTVEQVVKTYGKDVRVVWKNNPLPFHDKAALAAEASMEAADQGKFWEMHDKLFANQQKLAREDLEKYAQELGLNMTKFKAALDSNEHKSLIDADQQLARSLGASGTPSFFINGRSLRGAQPFEAFKTVIDEELQKAKDLAAKGTPRSQLYAKITENGATAPKFIEGTGAGAAPARADENKIYEIAAPSNAPSKGAKNAKVVIQEFSEFQCPFCSRVLPQVKQVVEEYGDKVQIVWRNYPLPFHDKAQKAAEAAHEVFEQGGSEKFWAYHDVLFANQQALTPDDLIKHAAGIGGINTTKLKAALDSDKHKSRVQSDVDAVAKSGARIGTPSFFINGKLLQGAQPYPAFKAAIDEALAKK
jgi:protein-disulfide isomerase